MEPRKNFSVLRLIIFDRMQKKGGKTRSNDQLYNAQCTFHVAKCTFHVVEGTFHIAK